MGTWSAEPVGNDAAADFVGELEDQRRWGVVEKALANATASGAPVDADTAELAIAAAEVVAHGLGNPTQVDAYTDGIGSFVSRAHRPNRRLAQLALRAVEAAADERGELAELWAESEPDAWREAVARLVAGLQGGHP